jgi:uncharacterized membrane protein YdjX (TVP38/TMEM64 family)
MTDDGTGAELPAQRGIVWRRAIIITLLCIFLAVVASSDALHAALLQVLAASEDAIKHHPFVGVAVFVAFAAISAMLAFVSAAIIVPVAVFTWGAPLSMLLLWTGWILGGVCSYAIGRFLGRAVVDWLTTGALLRRFESRVQRNSPFGLILLFQLAVPSENPGYVLGLLCYSLPRYLLALAISELPYAAATVYVGESFVERRSVMVLGAGLALVVLSVGSFYLLRQRSAR